MWLSTETDEEFIDIRYSSSPTSHKATPHTLDRLSRSSPPNGLNLIRHPCGPPPPVPPSVIPAATPTSPLPHRHTKHNTGPATSPHQSAYSCLALPRLALPCDTLPTRSECAGLGWQLRACLDVPFWGGGVGLGLGWDGLGRRRSPCLCACGWWWWWWCRGEGSEGWLGTARYGRRERRREGSSVTWDLVKARETVALRWMLGVVCGRNARSTGLLIGAGFKLRCGSLIDFWIYTASGGGLRFDSEVWAERMEEAWCCSYTLLYIDEGTGCGSGTLFGLKCLVLAPCLNCSMTEPSG